MNVLSNMEEHWRCFPELQRLFTNASLGNDFYHHGGLRSPYTTGIDDLHDLATIVAIVGRGEELIRTAARRAATEEPAEYVARMRRLVSELDHLARHLHCFTEGFLRERIEELRRQQDVIGRALSQAQEDEHRRGKFMSTISILDGVRKLVKKSLPPDWKGSKTTVTAARRIIAQEIHLPAAASLMGGVSETAKEVKRSPSKLLWCFRQARKVSEAKPGSQARPEKRLEKAVVQKENGLGDNWGNQIPTSSGLSQNRGDSRRNIDLANKSAGNRYRFIELKVRRGTNNPLSAGIELLEYAVLYVWVRQNFGMLGGEGTLPDNDTCSALLHAKSVTLEVLAPCNYYAGFDISGMKHVQQELDRTCVALGEQVGVEMRFRYKTLVDFDLTQMPATPSREWLASRFEDSPDHYPSV